MEEELLLVDPVSGAPVAVSGAALAAADCGAPLRPASSATFLRSGV
ncbi:hypothetical protein [Streptomyces sp. NPDC058632]